MALAHALSARKKERTTKKRPHYVVVVEIVVLILIAAVVIVLGCARAGHGSSARVLSEFFVLFCCVKKMHIRVFNFLLCSLLLALFSFFARAALNDAATDSRRFQVAQRARC